MVQRILVDAPSVADSDSDTEEISITSSNAQELMNQINNLAR